MRNLSSVLGPMRLPFLILTPACVLLGVGTALRASGRVNPFHVALVLVGAVAAHISVNAFNEYFDFRSGLDARTTRTPFSGGSGVLPAQPEAAPLALATAVTALVITAAIGLFFTRLRGPLLLLLGLLGLFIIVTYTVWLTRKPLLCLIAPGLGFGPLMVVGTHVALTGEFSWAALVASLVPFFLVSNLLLLNQFPDVEADRSIGRRHLPIVVGRRTSSLVYGAFLLCTYLAILVGVVGGYLPPLSLIGLLTVVIAARAFAGSFRYAEDIGRLIPYLGLNVIVILATPVLVSAGLLVG